MRRLPSRELKGGAPAGHAAVQPLAPSGKGFPLAAHCIPLVSSLRWNALQAKVQPLANETRGASVVARATCPCSLRPNS